MLDKLTNSGMAALNMKPATGQDTLIVLGVARSGTTMPATALYNLGVFLGDAVGQGVFEDQRIAHALEKNREPIQNVIRDYNRFSVWGFKRPMAFRIIEEHLHLFRNPRFVVMFRDPVAIAMRNQVSMGGNFATYFPPTVKQITELSEFVTRQKCPVLAVSYEKAVSRPTDFLQGLADFCGLTIPEGREKDIVGKLQNGPEHYLMASQVRFKPK